MPINNQLSKGHSLIELLIGLALSLVLLTAVVASFSANVNYVTRTVRIAKLNSQLQGALEYMSNEIRRAGYWSNASSNIDASSNTNPFMSTSNSTDINVPNSSCILFTYDHNKTGTLPAISASSDDDRYGFMLNNQVLQTRPFGAAFSCATGSNGWENITDNKDVLITNLSFTLNSTTVASTGSTSVMVRTVTITITGQLQNDSTVTKTLTQLVRIRNDRFTPP